MPPRLFPLHQLVEAHSEHSSDELEEGQPLALADRAEIGRERLGAFGRLVAAPVIFEAQRRREALLFLAPGDVACEGLAGGDCGQHAAFGPRSLEAFDLGIGPARFRRRGGAQHDQELRGGERRLDLFGEVAARRQVLLVAEDGGEAAGNDAVGGQLSGQRARHPEPLELAMEPVGEFLVAVAVAEEGVVASA